MLDIIRYVYMLRPVWAVLAALFVGAGLIAVSGVNPLTAYSELFSGAFLDYYGLAGTLVKTSPILLAGLAVILPLRAGLLNIGVEGQIYMGGLFSTFAALLLPPMPAMIHLPICILFGALGGGLWGLIPGYLKALHGLNEVIVTILLNFIAINIVSFVVGGPMMQEGAPYPYSDEIGEQLFLPIVLPGTDAHIGFLVGLVLAVAMYFLLRFTTTGFALDTIGSNPQAARYAGIPVRRYVMLSMFAAGAIGGLAGALEILGLKHRLYHLFSPGYGFDGIVVAFMAQLNPLFAPVAAFFLSGLKAGALVMQRAVGLESTVIEAILGLVIIFVAASLAFTYNRTFWKLLLERRRQVEADLGASMGEK
ncbi:ABC transporter permease [Aminobacter anthyllidis]|uniref:ABC transporter permease n=1 Tax=Aminobacter anthyllidis TaxID=1035067 RepID=A0A9X1ACF3_9HYPH|nr:ABC transporter permease [Aminobacter anthyllidis]MBT1157182.1 ABC transporter permease [Aminobacter anthyllidis]